MWQKASNMVVSKGMPNFQPYPNYVPTLPENRTTPKKLAAMLCGSWPPQNP